MLKVKYYATYYISRIILYVLCVYNSVICAACTQQSFSFQLYLLSSSFICFIQTQYLVADCHYRKLVLPRCLDAIRQFIELMQKKREMSEEAVKFRRYVHFYLELSKEAVRFRRYVHFYLELSKEAVRFRRYVHFYLELSKEAVRFRQYVHFYLELSKEAVRFRRYVHFYLELSKEAVRFRRYVHFYLELSFTD